MRIHLPLDRKHFDPQPAAGPSSSPLVNIGGELVLIELQGELSWEGDRSGKVIGLLGLERPDKPTLHLGEHHLLHGKITSLQKPYAVIRRVYGAMAASNRVDDDDDEEEDDEVTPQKRTRGPKEDIDDDEDDDEPPLFPPEPTATPSHTFRSSSPVYPPSAARDYSSELDFSSPARFGHDDEEEEERLAEEARDKALAKRREKRKREEKERTRHYEVVGVVRKKVVFDLRPEPIVTATVLPE